MSLPKNFISYALIVILSTIILFQYIGANKAERRAEQLEAQAKDIDAQLKSFEQRSAEREAQAEARYQASLVESATLRSILAKGSQAPRQNAPQSQLGTILATQQPATPANPTAPSCDPFIYQGKPLVIEEFQVSVCDQKPMVQAEAAVALHDEKALVDKLNTELAEDSAKLALQEKALAAYKVAEAGYKKAAKKSRIKRVLGVAEKVGLFAAGVYLGRRF